MVLIIKPTLRYPKTYIIKAILLDGSDSYFVSGISCAKALGVSNNTITQRLNDGKPVKNKDGLISALEPL